MSGLDGGRINVGRALSAMPRRPRTSPSSISKETVQFGQPISNLQAVQFMLADMATEIQAARLRVYHAAWLKDLGCSATLAASMAKRFATGAVQILGGYGLMEDHKVERYMREAKMGQIVEGTNQIQRIIIARELLK